MSIKRKLHENLFAYQWWSILYNPFHITRRKLLVCFAEQGRHLQGALLDFGCGAKPYRAIFRPDTYTGCDIKQSGHDHSQEQIDFFYDGISLPVSSNSFDSLFSSEVFEHIFNADQMMSELNRVAKPGATLLLSCPFFWNEHEMPYDYCRYTSVGLKNLIERNGFTVEEQWKLGNRFSVFFQLMNLIVFDALSFHRKIWILGAPIFFLFNLAEMALGTQASTDSLYLTNVVRSKKV
jgi:SAM-dependent methyltransferase